VGSVVGTGTQNRLRLGAGMCCSGLARSETDVEDLAASVSCLYSGVGVGFVVGCFFFDHKSEPPYGTAYLAENFLVFIYPAR